MTDSEMLAMIRALLPDTYSDSKDWRTGNVTERIIWLKLMVESKTEEVDRLIDILNDGRIEARAAEIERLEKACAEWAEVSQSNYQRAKAAEAKLAKAVEALRFYAWENEMRLPSEGPWGTGSTDFGKVARTTLAEIKGESHV